METRRGVTVGVLALLAVWPRGGECQEWSGPSSYEDWRVPSFDCGTDEMGRVKLPGVSAIVPTPADPYAGAAFSSVRVQAVLMWGRPATALFGWRLHRDAQGRVLEATGMPAASPNRDACRFTYDAKGRVIRHSRPRGGWEATFSKDGRTEYRTGARRGHSCTPEERLTYDAKGRLIRFDEWCGAKKNKATTRLTYGRHGLTGVSGVFRIERKGPREVLVTAAGQRVEITRDGDGKIVQLEDKASGAFLRMSVHPDGLVVERRGDMRPTDLQKGPSYVHRWGPDGEYHRQGPAEKPTEAWRSVTVEDDQGRPLSILRWATAGGTWVVESRYSYKPLRKRRRP